MQATLGELALLVGGQVVGPNDLVLQGAASLRDALPGQITMLDSADRARTLAGSKASAVVCPRSFLPRGTPAIQVDDSHQAFSRIVSYFRPLRTSKRIGISPSGRCQSHGTAGGGRRCTPLCHNRRRRDDRGRLDHPLRRACHGWIRNRRERDHISWHGALREYGRRPPVAHSCLRGARRLWVWLRPGGRPPLPHGPVGQCDHWRGTSRSGPARRSTAARTARRSSATARRSTTR